MERNRRIGGIALRPLSLKELANLYDVKPRTIKLWLEPINGDVGVRIGRFYTIRQVEIIFEKLGAPNSMVIA